MNTTTTMQRESSSTKLLSALGNKGKDSASLMVFSLINKRETFDTFKG